MKTNLNTKYTNIFYLYIHHQQKNLRKMPHILLFIPPQRSINDLLVEFTIKKELHGSKMYINQKKNKKGDCYECL